MSKSPMFTTFAREHRSVFQLSVR